MFVRASAVSVVVASLLACGGLGGPAPTERAIALAETRVRERYAEHDEVATAIGLGDTMTIDWVVYTPESSRLRTIDDQTYLVVPYAWESTSPIQAESFAANPVAWDSNGNELAVEHRMSRETCAPDGDLDPRGEGPHPPHWGGATPNATGHCEFLFEIDPTYADNILFVLERDQRITIGQYFAHVRKEPWVVDLGPATTE